jgi:D-glycero-D-manno-heptose 1,7-bisphosphate phosphatase
MRRAVFLDRDGVLNRLVVHQGRAVAPRALAEFALLPGVATAVAALRRAALLAVVVTNQPEIARGQLDPAELARMHEHLRRSVPVDAIYVCPHDDVDGCPCRKPKPGLLEQASRDWNLSLGTSFLVGDTEKDLAGGRAAGCATILIAPAKGPPAGMQADFTAPDLPAAAALILRAVRQREREPAGTSARAGKLLAVKR